MPVTVTATKPTAGQTGTPIRITGTGFVATPKVLFGRVQAQSVTFVSATELWARVPRVGAQEVAITVINPDQTEGSLAGFVVVPPGGWGKQPYGVSAFGASVAGAVSMKRALAVTTRQVDVELTGAVRDNSPYFEGDALNPSTWQVQRLDTNAQIPVVGVEQVGTNTYRILCLEEFGPASVEHLVSTANLLDASGNLLATPRQLTFLGLLDEDAASNEAKLAKRRVAVRDIANPQKLGTLVVDAGGDYQTVTGEELVRKLILRRLMSTPGDFFHLPEYGLGAATKEPLRVSDVARFKAAVERQVLEEDEVETARATVTLSANGVLEVVVRARLAQSGQQISVSYSPSAVLL